MAYNKLFKHNTYQNLLLGLLISSGSLKVLLEYYNFPVDITVIIFLLIIVDIAFTIFFKKKIFFNQTQLFYLILLIGFYFISLLSLYYTPEVRLGIEKFSLMLIPFIGFIYIKIIGRVNLKFIYRILICVAVPISIWFIIFKFYLWNESSIIDLKIDKLRFNPLRNTYLNFAYLLGVVGILCLKYTKNKLLVILLISALIITLGARGALLFLFLSYLLVYYSNVILFFKKFKIKKRVFNFILFSLFPLLTLLFIFYDKVSSLVEYGLIRFTSLINTAKDQSVLGRVDQYNYVISESLSIKGMTGGHGLGSFGVNYTNINALGYPHNIFLEAWYELGFFAMCLLIMFLVFPFFHLKRNATLKALAIYAFFNAMKTLSFSTDRNLFIFFGMLIFLSSTHKALKSTS